MFDDNNRGILLWTECSNLMKALGLPEFTVSFLREAKCPVDQSSAAGLSWSELTRVLESSAFQAANSFNSNRHGSDYNARCIRKALELLSRPQLGVTYDDIKQIRMAFFLYEGDAPHGIALEKKVIQATLRLAGKVIGPKRLDTWLLFSFHGKVPRRIQLDEIMDLLTLSVNRPSLSSGKSPFEVVGVSKNADGLYDLVESNTFMHPDERLALKLNNEYTTMTRKMIMGELEDHGKGKKATKLISSVADKYAKDLERQQKESDARARKNTKLYQTLQENLRLSKKELSLSRHVPPSSKQQRKDALSAEVATGRQAGPSSSSNAGGSGGGAPGAAAGASSSFAGSGSAAAAAAAADGGAETPDALRPDSALGGARSETLSDSRPQSALDGAAAGASANNGNPPLSPSTHPAQAAQQPRPPQGGRPVSSLHDLAGPDRRRSAGPARAASAGPSSPGRPPLHASQRGGLERMLARPSDKFDKSVRKLKTVIGKESEFKPISSEKDIIIDDPNTEYNPNIAHSSEEVIRQQEMVFETKPVSKHLKQRPVQFPTQAEYFGDQTFSLRPREEHDEGYYNYYEDPSHGLSSPSPMGYSPRLRQAHTARRPRSSAGRSPGRATSASSSHGQSPRSASGSPARPSTAGTDISYYHDGNHRSQRHGPGAGPGLDDRHGQGQQAQHRQHHRRPKTTESRAGPFRVVLRTEPPAPPPPRQPSQSSAGGADGSSSAAPVRQPWQRDENADEFERWESVRTRYAGGRRHKDFYKRAKSAIMMRALEKRNKHYVIMPEIKDPTLKDRKEKERISKIIREPNIRRKHAKVLKDPTPEEVEANARLDVLAALIEAHQDLAKRGAADDGINATAYGGRARGIQEYTDEHGNQHYYYEGGEGGEEDEDGYDEGEDGYDDGEDEYGGEEGEEDEEWGSEQWEEGEDDEDPRRGDGRGSGQGAGGESVRGGGGAERQPRMHPSSQGHPPGDRRGDEGSGRDHDDGEGSESGFSQLSEYGEYDQEERRVGDDGPEAARAAVKSRAQTSASHRRVRVQEAGEVMGAGSASGSATPANVPVLRSTSTALGVVNAPPSALMGSYIERLMTPRPGTAHSGSAAAPSAATPSDLGSTFGSLAGAGMNSTLRGSATPFAQFRNKDSFISSLPVSPVRKGQERAARLAREMAKITPRPGSSLARQEGLRIPTRPVTAHSMASEHIARPLRTTTSIGRYITTPRPESARTPANTALDGPVPTHRPREPPLPMPAGVPGRDEVLEGSFTLPPARRFQLSAKHWSVTAYKEGMSRVEGKMMAAREHREPSDRPHRVEHNAEVFRTDTLGRDPKLLPGHATVQVTPSTTGNDLRLITKMYVDKSRDSVWEVPLLSLGGENDGVVTAKPYVITTAR